MFRGIYHHLVEVLEGIYSRFVQNDEIGPLQDPVTWYRINYTGTQITQWNFQNKG